jgi:hypothetical protein
MRGSYVKTDQMLPGTEIPGVLQIMRIGANDEPVMADDARFASIVTCHIVCNGELPDTHYYYG